MKKNETWKDRVLEFHRRKRGDGIRLRIPEDIDELIADWLLHQSRFYPAELGGEEYDGSIRKHNRNKSKPGSS